MKISKSILKRLKNIVLSVGFMSTFAFGHLIACGSNQKELDATPVITVPIQQPLKVLSPTTVNVTSDNVNIVYLVNGVQTLSSDYTMIWTNDIKLSVDGNSLFCTIDNSYYVGDALYGDASYSFDLGDYTSPTDLTIVLNYTMASMVAPSTHSTLTFNVFLTYRRNTIPYQFIYNLYNVNMPSSSSSLLNDYIASGFINFMFNDYQSLFNNGVDSVLSNPNDYDLYTYQQYLAYGQSEYQRGFSSSTQTLSFSGFVREIFRSPVTMFTDAFNFNLPLGNGEVINVGGILTFFLTIGIALTIVQLILKVGGH